MSSQVSPQEVIYTGIWTDWTRGRVQGLTLTVPSSHGTILIAFLAIFVKVAGGHFWDIFCYVLFHTRSTTDARDALYHQQQALLRNNLSDNRAIWQFSALAWGWRGKAKSPILRTLPLLLSAVGYFLAFSAAGIFSSKVVSTASNVLISGPSCGQIWQKLMENPVNSAQNKTYFTDQSEMIAWTTANWKTSATYSESCYPFNNTQNMMDQPNCQAYGRQLIPWSIDTSVKCPFADGMCIEDLAVEFDSGYINSQLHLGINSPPEDRIELRHVLQCAPIVTEGFVTSDIHLNGYEDSEVNYNLNYPNARYDGYLYGTNLFTGTESTYVYNNATFGQVLGNGDGSSMYSIDTEWATLGDLDGSSFVPLPALNRTDGDVILIFIANNDLYFADAVNDPVFKANVSFPEVIAAPVNNNGSYQNVTLTYFGTPEPVSVVGCVRQYQSCNPAAGDSIGGNCTKMGGWHSPQDGLLGLNARQEAVLQRLVWDIYFSRMEVIAGIGDDAISFSSIYSTTQVLAPLPEDQWIRELDRWFGMTLTNIQLQTVQYATGQDVKWDDQARTRPTSPDAEWMCASQMVQRNEYASFSMLGIILILLLGLLFITGNAIIDPIVTHFQSKKKKGNNTAIVSAWRRHHVLQLQSMLYESLGLGVWNRDALVPTTTGRETFGLPDLERHGDVVKLDDLSSRTASRVEQDENWPLKGGNGTSREKNASKVEGEYLLDVPMSSDPITWPE